MATTAQLSPTEIQNGIQVYSFLTTNGKLNLSPAAAAGIVGNMVIESGVNPESGGIDSNGYYSGGLVSWNAKGYPNVKSMQTGNASADMTTQLNYLLSNIQANPSLLSALQAAKNPQDAAWFFANIFERCASCGSRSGTQSRQDFASAFADYLLFTGVQIPQWHGGVSLPPIPGVTEPPTVPSVGSFTDLVGGLGSIISKLTSKNFWTRVGFVLLGTVMVLVGILLILSETKTGRTVEEGAALAAMA